MKHKLLITAFFVTGFIILGTIAAPTVIADSYSWQITGSTFFVHSYHTYKYCDLLEASSCSASNVNTVAYCQDSPDESPCPDPSNLAYCNIGAHQETCLDTTPAPTACTSAPNACGQTNSGSQPYGGICSASTPANPSFYGAACTSAANSCGMTNPGTLSCSDTCSAGAPSNSLCPAPPPPLPDLTDTATPSVSGTLGQPITVTTTILNQGTGPTTAGFPDLFVTNINAQQTAWNTLGNTWQGTLANGASTNVSYTFPAGTFSAPGSYTWDACANRNTSWAAVVTDSNYGNDCGPGGIITVNPPIPAAPTNPQTTCSADGKSVSFSWTASANATNYYPRMYAPSAAQCNSFGWQVWTDGATCYPNPDTWTATNVANFPITPGQNYAWYVAAGNSSGINWGATTGNSSFTCAGQPDITVAAGPTVSDTTNTPITLTGLVSNSPSGGAAGAFPNILQVCTDTGCSVSNVQNASGVSSLAAGASQTVTSSYTPSANGSYVYRMCGNLNTSWQNIITESNYGNNCGGWATLNVAYPAIGGTCSASPASGYAGQNVTWSAYATGGSGVYTYQWGGNVSGTSQTESQTYPSAGTYTGQVTVSSGGSNATIMCTPLSGVVIQSCNPTFTASPSTVDQGQSSTLTWSVPSSCSSSCTGSGFSTGGATSGTATVYPSAPSSSYALMCVSQPNKNVTIPVTVPSLSITANPTMASVGGATTLTWSASDVDSCSVTDSAGGTEQASASSDGSRNFTTGSPDHNIILTKSPETYTFACVSHGSTVSKSVTVNGNVKFKEF
jgi:hypothetical protein